MEESPSGVSEMSRDRKGQVEAGKRRTLQYLSHHPVLRLHGEPISKVRVKRNPSLDPHGPGFELLTICLTQASHFPSLSFISHDCKAVIQRQMHSRGIQTAQCLAHHRRTIVTVIYLFQSLIPLITMCQQTSVFVRLFCSFYCEQAL